MSNNMIWLIGAGYMGKEYAKVLNALDREYVVITRSQKSANSISSECGHTAISGGLDAYLATNPKMPESVIVTSSPESMYDNAIALMKYGVKKILLEKPAGVDKKEIESINNYAIETGTEIFVGYNRRYYQSVIKAKELIAADGGVTSFEFDFTEWSHQIEKLEGKLDIELNNWFYANSTHVIDLAFYLGGYPKEIACFKAGTLQWHPNGSRFTGAGVGDNDQLFSYHSNWESAGRWSVEINTPKHKFIFRPLEKLQVCDRGSVRIYEYDDIDYSLDNDFKPGLYLQVVDFLNGKTDILKSIKEQYDDCTLYDKMLLGK